MPDSVDIQPTWALQARKFFELLQEQSELDEYHRRVFTGKLGDVFKETGASNASYSKIKQLLLAYEVVRIIQVGNRHQPTVIEITGQLPEGDLMPPGHLTERTASATLVVEVERRVKSLTAWRESLEKGGLDIAKALQDFELRITRLEREVRRIGTPKKNHRPAK
jgi:hypothetical protein